MVCLAIALSQTGDFPKCQAFSWCFAKLGPAQDRVGVCLCIVFCNPEWHCSAYLHCVLQSSMVLVCVFVLCFGTRCKMQLKPQCGAFSWTPRGIKPLKLEKTAFSWICPAFQYILQQAVFEFKVLWQK